MQSILEIVVSNATGLKAQDIQISLRPALDFQSNRLYDVWADGQHLIAKEFLNPEEILDAPVREFQALKLLESLDIAPHPVFFDPGIAPIVVYEYMDGEMWDRQRPSPAQLAQLADVWLKIQAIPTEGLWFTRDHNESFQALETRIHDSFQRYVAWTAVNFPAGQRSAEYCLDLLPQFQTVTQELDEYAPVLCFCRSDPRFANVIQRPDGRLGLVDWEDSGLLDPARDLADLITHPNQEDLINMGDWQAFLMPYLTERGRVDATLYERVNLYLAILPIFWLSILLDSGIRKAQAKQINGWQVNGVFANDRLRHYLARALAWPKPYFHDELDSLGKMLFFSTR